LGERFVYTEEVAGSIPAPPIPGFRAWPDCADSRWVYVVASSQAMEGGKLMLWLIAGVVLLIIAIAGGAIVHPVLFALGIFALLIFFMRRTSTV
jgi:hypothetical protein